MGSGGTGADVLPQLHRKQFLKAGYVALSVVTPEFAVENRKTNSNGEKVERHIGRSLSFLEGKSTFQKLIKRYMDNVALREEAQMRLLARIKENHQKALKSPLMDRKYTSRRLVYQTKLDRFNRLRGEQLAEHYRDQIRDEEEQKEAFLKFMTYGDNMPKPFSCLHCLRNDSSRNSILPKGCLEKFTDMMNDVNPKNIDHSIHFDKRSNRFDYDLP